MKPKMNRLAAGKGLINLKILLKVKPS